MNDGPPLQGTIPSHLYHYEFNDLEELRSHLAQRYEDKNEATWEICDLCAVARRMFPYTRSDDTVDSVGRKLVGWLAHDLGCSGQQVRRFIKRAETFPPEVQMPDGELIIIRDSSKPLALYDVALAWGPRHKLDPLACIMKALDEDWSPGQLKHWIRDENRDEHDVPPVWCELHAVEIQNPTGPEEALDGLRDSLAEQFRVLKQANKPILSLKVRVEAYVPGDPPLT